jgi:hypothetical protein
MKFVQNAEDQNNKIRPHFFTTEAKQMRSAVRDISVTRRLLMTSSRLRTTRVWGLPVGSVS